MQELSQYINHTSGQLMHIDIQGLLDDPCFGDMVEEDKYVEGQYIGTFFRCEKCGHVVHDSQVPNPNCSSNSDSICGSWEDFGYEPDN